MPQINFKIPLRNGPLGQFDMNTNTKDAVKEDVKLTILTSIGERVISDVGSNYYYDAYTQTQGEVQAAVTEHTNEIFEKYFDFLKIESIDILVQKDNAAVATNNAYVKLKYSFRGIDNFIDEISFVV